MSYSMSTRRETRIGRQFGRQRVTVWGSDADGDEDGLPVVVAQGWANVLPDGPEPCRITTPEGVVYESTETSWAPLRGEWVCKARKVEPGEEAADASRWTLGYEAAGSSDAVWALRYGAGPDTIVYEANTYLGEFDYADAESWATRMLASEHSTTATGWTPHFPGPGTQPDHWTATTEEH
jgi:hypothetical protein